MSTPQTDPTPFQLTCTPAVPELLTKLKCTIALTTYQAGKLIFVSPQSEEQLVQLPRTFHRPMALQWKDGTLALSTGSSVELFTNDPRMAPNYPRQPNTYDALYLPRQTIQTGHVDTHGLEWGDDGTLWMVNTKFACLARLSSRFSFEPAWFPPFITDLAPEDRCHLNGVAFKDGRPVYATCLSQTNEREGWRKNLPNEGVLIDQASNEIVLRNLAMPHSPRFVGDRLYLLLSATGELVRVNPQSGTYDVVHKVGGFVRGMAYHRSHLFIAYSKLRKNSSTFRNLPIANEAN
ncbi:MAG: TIGR03032 family protein [Spirochaetales bacterium]|nr:MAG: TIGR03032 family protein [Spirochaetales bacterium]